MSNADYWIKPGTVDTIIAKVYPCDFLLSKKLLSDDSNPYYICYKFYSFFIAHWESNSPISILYFRLSNASPRVKTVYHSTELGTIIFANFL